MVENQKKAELEKLSNLSADEAKKELINVVEKQSEEDLMIRMQKLENGNAEKLEQKAKEILTTSIQRLASSVSQDIFTTSVAIPSAGKRNRSKKRK